MLTLSCMLGGLLAMGTVLCRSDETSQAETPLLPAPPCTAPPQAAAACMRDATFCMPGSNMYSCVTAVRVRRTYGAGQQLATLC
jgi:hypothetical protein